MSSSDYGYFQVVLRSTDVGQTETGQTTDYKINLQGQYKLKLVHIDLKAQEEAPQLRLVNLYSPQLSQFFGNTRNVTVMYPRALSSAETLGIFDYCFYINLNSILSLQWREDNGSPMLDFDISVLTFEYQKM